jgi:hypothetical protein
VPAEHTDGVWAALRKEILVTQGGHVDVGLHGNYFLIKLLTDTSMGFGDQDDLIYELATQTTHPGWGDLLSKGFTTWPEAWGSGGPASACNHYLTLCVSVQIALTFLSLTTALLHADARQPYKVPACARDDVVGVRSDDGTTDTGASSCWRSGALSPAHGTLNGIGQWFVQGASNSSLSNSSRAIMSFIMILSLTN